MLWRTTRWELSFATLWKRFHRPNDNDASTLAMMTLNVPESMFSIVLMPQDNFFYIFSEIFLQGSVKLVFRDYDWGANVGEN